MRETDKGKEIALNFNPGLSTPWIDMFNISMRVDGQCLVRFITELPEGAFEQSRIMTNKEHLQKFIDVLCPALDYYPEKKKEKKKKKSTS